MELSIQSLMGCLCGIRKVVVPEYSSSTLFGFVNYMMGNRDLPVTPMFATWLFVGACLLWLFPNALRSAANMAELYMSSLLLAAFVWILFWFLWPALMHTIGIVLVDQMRAPAIAWHGVSLTVVVLAGIAFLASLNYTFGPHRHHLDFSIQPTDGYSRTRPWSADSLSLTPHDAVGMDANQNAGTANSNFDQVKAFNGRPDMDRNTNARVTTPTATILNNKISDEAYNPPLERPVRGRPDMDRNANARISSSPSSYFDFPMVEGRMASHPPPIPRRRPPNVPRSEYELAPKKTRRSRRLGPADTIIQVSPGEDIVNYVDTDSHNGDDIIDSPSLYDVSDEDESVGARGDPGRMYRRRPAPRPKRVRRTPAPRCLGDEAGVQSSHSSGRHRLRTQGTDTYMYATDSQLIADSDMYEPRRRTHLYRESYTATPGGCIDTSYLGRGESRESLAYEDDLVDDLDDDQDDYVISCNPVTPPRRSVPVRRRPTERVMTRGRARGRATSTTMYGRSPIKRSTGTQCEGEAGFTREPRRQIARTTYRYR